MHFHRWQYLPLDDWQKSRGYSKRRICRTCSEEQVLIPGLQAFMLLALMLCLCSGCMACKKVYVYAWDSIYPPPAATTTNGATQ